MNRLRFKISSENIAIGELFSTLGFPANADLNFDHFRKLLHFISPKITLEEVRYFFDRID